MRIKNLDNERGAVLAIVALSLVALMGMTVLVVDVGGLLVMKRRLVTTADAAALAAAQQCALRNGEAAARAEADEVAQQNVGSTSGNIRFGASGCSGSGGEAAADFSADQRLFFAPILGLGENITVSAPATAIWGPARVARTTPPINLNTQGGNTFPCAFDPAHPCTFWADNSDPLGSNSEWSFLGLEPPEWPANVAGNTTNRTCPNNDFNKIGTWTGGRETRLVAQPTYVCALNGRGGAATQSQQFQKLKSMEGKPFQFAVSDPNKRVTTNGREKFAVIGFVTLKVISVLQGTGGASGTCPAVPYTFLKPPPAGGDSFDATIAYAACALTAPAGAVLTPNVLRSPGNSLVSPTDYTWNPTTKLISGFSDFGPPTPNQTVAQIYFTWETSGPCGAHAGPPQPNSFCIVTEWIENQLGGADPDPTAPDVGGLKGVRLSE